MSSFSADYSDLLHGPFDRIADEVFDLLPAEFTQGLNPNRTPTGMDCSDSILL